MPFYHLIALIIDVHQFFKPSAELKLIAASFKAARRRSKKTISCFERIRERRGQAALT
jgi:hypothetical protein